MAAQKERRATPRKTVSKNDYKPVASQPAKSTPTPRTQARANASDEELKRLIAEAAYYRAQERGFKPGYELEDWVQAEAEVRRRLERRA